MNKDSIILGRARPDRTEFLSNLYYCFFRSTIITEYGSISIRSRLFQTLHGHPEVRLYRLPPICWLEQPLEPHQAWEHPRPRDQLRGVRPWALRHPTNGPGSRPTLPVHWKRWGCWRRLLILKKKTYLIVIFVLHAKFEYRDCAKSTKC